MMMNHQFQTVGIYCRLSDEDSIKLTISNFEKEINKKLEPEISKYSIYSLAVNNFKKVKNYTMCI